MPFTERSGPTRAAILAAARRRFSDDGFERTTVRAVAGDAGVDPSMVMRYFENKDGLFNAAIAVDLQLPDRMLRTETMNPVGDMTVVVEQGINGETLLRNQRTLNGPPGAIVRMAPPPANADAEAQAVRNARADLARTVLVMLLTSPASRVPLVTNGSPTIWPMRMRGLREA